MISVYNKKSNVEINARRLEQLEQWGSIIQYGRQNPVWFIEQILGCPLLDYQKFMILGGWTAQKAIYVQSRGSGKSFVASLIIMAKTILYPAYSAYIMAPTARQSNELTRARRGSCQFVLLETFMMRQESYLTNFSA